LLTRDYWRLLHALSVMIAVAMLGIVIYLQIVEFVMPCLFCIDLRLITIAYGLTCLLALVHKPGRWGRTLYSWLGIFYSVLAIAISAYILWLQKQPSDVVTACGQGIGAELIDWPFGETLMLLFAAYGECATVTWTLWGYSLAVLSLCGFIGLLLFEIIKYRMVKRRDDQRFML